MSGTTRGIAVLLMCVACASRVAAQATDNLEARGERQRVFKLQQAEAKAAAAQRRAGARIGRGRIGGQAEASETVSRTVRLEPGGTFDLSNAVGDVTITGGSGSEANIKAIKTVRAISGERAHVVLPMIRVEIAERGGNVEVRTVHPARAMGRVDATVDYIVTLPENANLILRSTSGNFTVQRMASDELSANTVSGNVTLSDLKSRLLDLHSVMGNLLLRDIDARRALVQSTAGNVEYAGRFQRTGRYQLQTHGGNIRVTPSGNPGLDLDAMTYSGDVRSDFVLRGLRERPAGPRGARAQKFLRGTVGDAGAMLTMSSFSGNIVLVKPETP